MKKIFLFFVICAIMLSASAQNLSSGQISLDCTMDVRLLPGFTHTEIFILNGERFLFNHNSANGDTRVWNLDKGGDPVFTRRWSSGWTNINFYEYKGEVYFFHQKGDDGLVRINKLDYNSLMNGSNVGNKVYEAKWSRGWTNTLFFVHNDILYFLHYKAGNGLARLNASKDGASVGTKIYEKTWAKGYSNFAMTNKGSNFYIIYQNSQEGTSVINQINLERLEAAANAGLISPDLGRESYRGRWSSGWENFTFFNLDGEVYLFINKPATGLVHIERLKDDGTLGPRVFQRTWSKGWTGIDVFYTDGKPQLLHQKTESGHTKSCELKF